MNQNQPPINRVNRSKQAAQASYDSMSRFYDLFAASEKKYKQAGLQKLNAAPGETILEIGFGTGQCLKTLAQSVADSGKVYGIDLSAGMLKIAKERIEKANLSANVELHSGDAANLPFKSDFFDAVFISFTLELFDTPEIPRVLHECRRVLHPGSRICIVSMKKKNTSNLMVSLYEWAQKNFTQYVDCRPIYARSALQEAGFQIENTTEMSMFGLPVDIILATT